jgi:acetyl-CoA carboxylase biotin carboxylase subunit
MTDDLRSKMGDLAVKAAEFIKYMKALEPEFLVDKQKFLLHGNSTRIKWNINYRTSGD